MLDGSERVVGWCALALALAACGADDGAPATGSATVGGSSDAGGTEASAGPGTADDDDDTASSNATNADGDSGETAADDTGGPMNDAEPSRYPLELVAPRAPGTSPSADPGTPAMPAGHRHFKAYPGLEYDIRAVVIGGSYPYTFSLADAPEGMTIDARTGEITWPSPSGGPVTPTLIVVDAEGTELSSSWTIEVDTASFRFVDAAQGNDGNAGTIDSPWQSLVGVLENSNPGEIVVLRAGTYVTQDMPVDGSDTWVRVEFNGAAHSVQWLAYPGETPVIDNGYSLGAENSRFLRFFGSEEHPVYLDGLAITNAWDKGIQFVSGTDYAVFRRLDIHGIAEAIDGSNSAGIMTLSGYSDPSWYAAYQDSDFHDNASGGIKQYSHRKLLWEDLTFRDSGGGPDLKAHVPRFEVRGCSFLHNGDGYCGLFGNLAMSNDTGETASGEIRYNLVLCGDSPTTWAMDVNQDGQSSEIHLYRNTFVGTVRVRNTDSADGPFDFTHNVIVNSSTEQDHVTFEAVDDPTRVTFSDNLTGTPADAIVDENGELQGAYVEHLGTRGHVIP
jgi:hypothetical protein